MHSAHFNLSLLSDIWKQGLWFKTQKSKRHKVMITDLGCQLVLVSRGT